MIYHWVFGLGQPIFGVFREEIGPEEPAKTD
jgi:hypothetical protein